MKHILAAMMMIAVLAALFVPEADAQRRRPTSNSDAPSCVVATTVRDEYDSYRREREVFWEITNRCDGPVNVRWVYNDIGFHNAYVDDPRHPWHEYSLFEQRLNPGQTHGVRGRYQGRYGDLQREPTLYFCASYTDRRSRRCPENALD